MSWGGPHHDGWGGTCPLYQAGLVFAKQEAPFTKQSAVRTALATPTLSFEGSNWHPRVSICINSERQVHKDRILKSLDLQVVEGQTANGRCSVRVRVHALPQQVAAALDDNEAVMSRTLADESGKNSLGKHVFLFPQSAGSPYKQHFKTPSSFRKPFHILAVQSMVMIQEWQLMCGSANEPWLKISKEEDESWCTLKCCQNSRIHQY